MSRARHRSVVVLASSLLLVGVVALAVWRLLAPQLSKSGCDLNRGPCELRLGAQPVELELLPPRPRPGEALVLSLRPVGGARLSLPFDSVTADFSMPGMDMGDHRLPLEATGPATLEGEIILPTCPMGQSGWKVVIRAPGVAPLDAHFDVAR